MEENNKSNPDIHTTTMKRLSLQVVANDLTTRVATLTNTWLSIPQTKSYDDIGLRIASSSSYISLASISGTQEYDGSYIYYSGSSNNTKTDSSKHVGISMNIVDSTSSSLENKLVVTYSAASGLNAYGAYEHATSNVTLSQAKNYSFSSGGQGSVFGFANSVNSLYDNMQGVHVNY